MLRTSSDDLPHPRSSTKLRADELYLIALAIDVDPAEAMKEVCGNLKLKHK
jgi:hypothetical protein